MRSKVFVWTGLLLCLTLMASVAEATVLRVVVVKTTDAQAYAKEIERGKALLKKAGSPGIVRVWRARYAGQDTGSVVVSVEFADLAALAKDNERMATDPELLAWLKGLDQFRTVVSDSVYDELAP